MFDVIIIGGGAAGLMCAIEAGKRGRSVVVLERNDTPGKKIRISGGGRCNFTNIHTTPEHFISGNPNFHESALAQYTPEDFIAMVRRDEMRPYRFMAVFGIHLGGYIGGMLGTIIAAWRVNQLRKNAT